MSRSTTKAPPARSTLILVRHAHTNLAGRFCGHSDPPLSEQGLAQLADLNQRLKNVSPTHIFCSDLQRARQTAEPIAQRCQLQPNLLASLRELAFGSWEGLDWDQVMARDPVYAQRWLDLSPSIPAPGGESFEDFLSRIHGAMNAIATEVQDGCAVVVTHAGVIRTFLGDLAQVRSSPLDFSKCDYTSCWEVWRKERQWSLPAVNHHGAGMSSDGRRQMSD
jgi:alpha-ribazole phosphatase/probable phosphoglycerate mutase